MCVRCVRVGGGGGGNGCTAEQATQRSAEAGGYFDQLFCSYAVMTKSINSRSARMLIVLVCAATVHALLLRWRGLLLRPDCKNTQGMYIGKELCESRP